jgi:hypothetical protein
MGDTYFIDKLNCVYCEKENNFICSDSKEDEVTLASLYPGIGWTSEQGAEFVCESCKKKNKVKMEFIAVKTIKSRNKKSVLSKVEGQIL